MRWIVGSSLRFGRLVVALAIGLLVFGVAQLRSAPVDVYPEFTPPSVQIQTEAHGLSAAEVEQLITVPLEQDLLNGIPWLDRISSESMTGLSSRELSLIDMSVLARWKIRPKLMGIPGVANVAIWGQRDRQLQVLVDPDRLRNHNVTLDDVVRSTREAVAVAAGGFVDTPNQRLPVAHLSSVTQPQDLARVPVAFRNGAPLELGAVAEVVEGFPPPIGDAVINDGPGLLLIVEKQPTGNTLDVTRNVEAAL